MEEINNYSEIELRPDSVVEPLGDCRFRIDGRELEFRIRKLTPKECLRLMDVPEKNIAKMMAHGEKGQLISNSQLYKLAGNSIVVSCLYHLYESMLYPTGKEMMMPKQLTLF